MKNRFFIYMAIGIVVVFGLLIAGFFGWRAYREKQDQKIKCVYPGFIGLPVAAALLI